MIARSPSRFWALALLATITLSPAALSDEVKGKWRAEIHIGGYDPGDSIESETDNVQAIRFEDGSARAFGDFRPLNVSPARLDTSGFVEVRLSHGLHSWRNGELVLDTGIGFFESTLEDLEFSYLLDRAQSPFIQQELVEGGTMKSLPVSVGLYARYSPTKRFNPYFGVNLGYLMNEFNESRRWKEIADALDASLVAYVERDPSGDVGLRQIVDDPRNTTELFVSNIELSPFAGDLYTQRLNRDLDGDGSEDCSQRGYFRIIRGVKTPTPCFSIVGHDVARPRIETPDTFFFELRGGAEWQWRPKVAVFGELRFSWAAKNIEITTDGLQQFGQGVGNGTFSPDDAPAPIGGRPAYISQGGIIENAGGVTGPQPGQYWLNGGILDYGGFTFTGGLRFSL